MADTFRPTPADNYTGSSSYGSASNKSYEPTDGNNDVGRTLLVGIVGGLLSAAGYLVYQRLPDEQRDKLHGQVRNLLQDKINEVRSNFNL